MRIDLKHLIIIFVLIAAVFLIMMSHAGPLQVKAGKATLELTFSLPQGFEFTEGAPFKLEWDVDQTDVIQLKTTTASGFNPAVPYTISFTANPGNAVISLNAALYYCDKKSRMCFQDVYQTSIPVEVKSSGSSTPSYTWHLKTRR